MSEHPVTGECGDNTEDPGLHPEFVQEDAGPGKLAQDIGDYGSPLAWPRRCHDRSHTRKNLLASLCEAQEATVDDLLAAMSGFIHPKLSRAALDCCLRRNEVARLVDLAPAESCDAVKTKPFKPYESGYIHIEYKYLPPMPDQSGRRYLFVAIDRATRWVYVEITAHKDAR